jgi:xanthine dehydrogenase accessory factor
MAEDLLALAAELGRRGEAFALATVVRCERPTSAKPGAKALVRADGSISGWVGGACAEPVVVREALKALRDGQPRFIGLVGEGKGAPGRTEGIFEYPMTCHSGGTLEIYVEPYLPTPLLLLIGHGPVVEMLATLGRAAGYTIQVLPADALAEGLAGTELNPRASVVVATHGELDDEALARVLAEPVGYVSLVASRKRAAVIVERLRRRGLAPERLERLKAPAGLDIGAVTPEEIAVSILAEMVQHHRSVKPLPVIAEARAQPAAAAEATDPICKMSVNVATARYQTEVSGQTVYFCSLGCKERFDRDPAPYLSALER